jgi:hypothetical protein
MSNEAVIQELPAGDIARGGEGVVRAGGEQQQGGFREQAPQPAQMSADQQAGVREIDNLRGEYGKPGADTDQLVKRISELQRHVFNGGSKPSWYGDQKPDPKLTDLSEHNPMSQTFARAMQPMTGEESGQLRTHGLVKGLAPASASFVAQVAQRAGLDLVSGKTLADRAAHHASMGWGVGVPMNEVDVRGCCEHLVRFYGSTERAIAESTAARKYVAHAGIGDMMRALGSLNFDPVVIQSLAYRARALGL